MESKELAKQKKALEDKRNFINQVPAGGFKRAFGEYEINYKNLKDEHDSAIAKRREEEKNQLRNHQGSLKHRPKKTLTGVDQIGGIATAGSISVVNSVEVNRGGILTNRYAEEVYHKEFAKQK